jgi:hypothetical protein
VFVFISFPARPAHILCSKKENVSWNKGFCFLFFLHMKEILEGKISVFSFDLE